VATRASGHRRPNATPAPRWQKLIGDLLELLTAPARIVLLGSNTPS
jgi:hypothetical protein